MTSQALFFLKDKRKKLKCRLLQFLFGTLRDNSLQKIKKKALFSTHMLCMTVNGKLLACFIFLIALMYRFRIYFPLS